jgi:hypothetical protein
MWEGLEAWGAAGTPTHWQQEGTHGRGEGNREQIKDESPENTKGKLNTDGWLQEVLTG